MPTIFDHLPPGSTYPDKPTAPSEPGVHPWDFLQTVSSHLPHLPPDALGQVAGGMNWVLNKVENSPPVRMATEPAGIAAGALGGVVGGAVGGLGNLAANAIQGKPLGQGFAEDVKRTASDTAKAGYMIGKGGMEASLLQGGGKIVNVLVAAPKIATGLDEIKKGNYTSGGVNLGVGLLALHGALNQEHLTPGGAFDQQIKNWMQEGKIGIPGAGVIRDEAKTPMGDVWKLESPRQDAASEDLQVFADQAMKGDKGAQSYLRKLWDGESWASIKDKLKTEGSTWYVWWMDGVNKHMGQMKGK